MSRRTASKALVAGAAALAAGFPAIVRASRPRVVVVGGGAGGATAARTLALTGDLDVTLVEASRHYYTCFFSNLYLGGLRDYASIGHSYERLARQPRLTVVHEWASAIDAERAEVRLASGARIPYERLILSPGIDMDYEAVPGYSAAVSGRIPHAWKSATDVARLRHLVTSMRQGGTFVMVAPPDPSRCPPAPYERASMIANVFKQTNPKAKIVIIDAKESFTKQTLFQTGWEQHYGDMILWLPVSISGGLERVDADSMSFVTELESFKADAATVVPPQRAARVAAAAGLTDDSGWCPIVPATMASRFDERIHIVGDAAVASAMPKSAFSANAQAKLAAAAVHAALTGRPRASAALANHCWSFIAPDDVVSVGANYRPSEAAIEVVKSFLSEVDETTAVRQAAGLAAEGWYRSIVADMFG